MKELKRESKYWPKFTLYKRSELLRRWDSPTKAYVLWAEDTQDVLYKGKLSQADDYTRDEIERDCIRISKRDAVKFLTRKNN